MKNITNKNKFLPAFILLTFISFGIKAQTNVSGGIFANTTWTLANSPYIVTDTVVVFPNVTLTIQPGVVVKFNPAVQLELRQAALVAWGNNTDSITFTSNTSNVAGVWDQINLNGGTMTSKFNYCNFKYASRAIADNRGGSGDSIIIKNSNFIYNTYGLFGQGTFYGKIDSCNFRHNTTGVLNNYGGIFTFCDFSYNQSSGFDCDSYNTLNNCSVTHNTTGMSNMRNTTVNNCVVCNNSSGILAPNNGVWVKFSTVNSNSVVGIDIGTKNITVQNCIMKNNAIAINDHNSWGSPCTIKNNSIENNSTGIKLSIIGDNIFCNKICSNSSYDLYYTGMNNVNVSNNYWCTPDSASTQAAIYDAHDNVNYGLVNYMPLDTSQCYLSSGTIGATGSIPDTTAPAGPTGIGSHEAQTFSFNLFPNPATDNLTVELPATISKAEIKIANLLGELEYSSKALTQKTTIDVSTLTNGLHIIQITSGNTISRQRFIKQ